MDTGQSGRVANKGSAYDRHSVRAHGSYAPALVLLLLLSLGAVQLWRIITPPSVLLITIDTLRPDRLGCYGHPKNKTPAIDLLASEGAVFERAYCDMPWTTGSMASVMTGRYSNEHGLRDPMSKLDPRVRTIAQYLHDEGAQTGAIVGSFPLDSVYGLDRGFETYDDEFSMPMLFDPNASVTHVTDPLPTAIETQPDSSLKRQMTDWYRPDEQVTDAAIRWLGEVRDGRPFFLWVHYFGPHERLDRTRNRVAQEPEIIAAYDSDVERTDRAVGRLLDHVRVLGILDRTLVILHADHGQNLGENDYVGHTLRLDEVAVRVPLIVRYPPLVPQGQRRRNIVRNVDILPTVLRAWAIGNEKTAGRSLFAVPSEQGDDAHSGREQLAYFETYMTAFFFIPQTTPGVGTLLGPMVSRGVRTPVWKLLANEFRGPCRSSGAAPARDGTGTWRLWNPTELSAEECATLGATELLRDSQSTPDGVERVDPEPAEVVAALKVELSVLATGTSAVVGEKFALSPEQEEKLKSLGYLR